MAADGWNEMREKVYAVVKDSSRTTVTEADVDLWIQEGMEELSSRLDITQAQKTDADTAISGNAIALPTDFKEHIWLQMDSTDDYAEFVDEDVWNSWQDSGGDPGHTLARVFNGNIECYPTPAAGSDYVLRYWTISSAPSSFTGSLRAKCVNYARAHALYKMDNPAMADRYMAMFEQGIPEPNVRTKNSQVLPTAIYLAGGYFDSSDYLS